MLSFIIHSSNRLNCYNYNYCTHKIEISMQQAYTNFNSGKYKQALTSLNSGNQNNQANVTICEYLSNRCTQSALNCLRRLNDLLDKKNKYDDRSIELNPQQIMKYNIGILLILLGKRQNALPVLRFVYTHRQCFIQYIQCRLLFLLMELENSLKNYAQTLTLYQYFIGKPQETKQTPTHWVSVGFHEHNKSTTVLYEEFVFFAQNLLSQSLIQLEFPDSALISNEQREAIKDSLLQKLKKRKNATNKCYELNIRAMDRFMEAHRQFHKGNLNKSLYLLNITNFQNQFEQLQLNKITLNLLNALALNNNGLIHCSLGKNTIALSLFKKSKELLSKNSNIDDKDLQVNVTNISNQNQRISENIGLALLNIKPHEAYLVYESIRKANHNSSNYKYWYRLGQSYLQYYHYADDQNNSIKNNYLLQSALTAYSQALIHLNRMKIPQNNLTKFYKNIKEEDLQLVIFKKKGQLFTFRCNIILLICYVSLILGLHHRVVKLCKQLLITNKIDDQSRFYAYNYLLQAYVSMGQINDAIKIATQLQKNLTQKLIKVSFNGKTQVETYDQQTLIYYQMCILNIKNGRITEAYKIAQHIQRQTHLKHNESVKALLNYMKLRMNMNKLFSPYMSINMIS